MKYKPARGKPVKVRSYVRERFERIEHVREHERDYPSR